MQVPTQSETRKPDATEEIKFTGIVVTYNESRRLRDCLNSLRFCSQLVVIDLGSTDSSVEIARQCGAEVVHHEKVPIVEHVREKAIGYARNDWIVFLDPDEVLPANIEKEVRSLIAGDKSLGLISLPWQFYFKGELLECTIWGQDKMKGVVFHKHRNRFSPYIHRPIQLMDSYSSATLPKKVGFCIQHYWVDSYAHLLEKHQRYINQEGESRYQRGERFSWHKWIEATALALIRNLFAYNGMRGGFLGIFLSFFYAWYVSMSLLSLRRYQKSIKKDIL